MESEEEFELKVQLIRQSIREEQTYLNGPLISKILEDPKKAQQDIEEDVLFDSLINFDNIPNL